MLVLVQRRQRAQRHAEEKRQRHRRQAELGADRQAVGDQLVTVKSLFL
jgi:hypothetical protein